MPDTRQSSERAEFALQLLLKLQEALKELSDISMEIEKNSDSFYKDYFKNNVSSIKEDMDSYISNNEKVKNLKLEVTAMVNDWFSFIKDENEVKSLTFPVKLYLKRKKLRNSIKNINASISNISIENRFIKEKLISWEHDLGIECIKAIKTGREFSHYEKLLKIKRQILDELKYILPTIEGVCPLELDLNNISQFIEKFRGEIVQQSNNAPIR
ncbi:MAG TPA: hypothetical protein VIO64_07045 [Pseudobacteroides sp.]|uniref:hypothetical protein n=1 Tax=Pseudobacteroides sp. TaxID=1968840 RepID=UPI002F91CE16